MNEQINKWENVSSYITASRWNQRGVPVDVSCWGNKASNSNPGRTAENEEFSNPSHTKVKIHFPGICSLRITFLMTGNSFMKLFMSRFSSVPLICMSVFTRMPYCLGSYCFMGVLKSDNFMCSSLSKLFQLSRHCMYFNFQYLKTLQF